MTPVAFLFPLQRDVNKVVTQPWRMEGHRVEEEYRTPDRLGTDETAATRDCTIRLEPQDGRHRAMIFGTAKFPVSAGCDDEIVDDACRVEWIVRRCAARDEGDRDVSEAHAPTVAIGRETANPEDAAR